ncbi:MAG: VOC family protein [Kordiimonadaceae bacterium]|nr:VOC family protein [Kordiimonadaceae bacterium]MBO6567116.1 VOC family protein [Kordiimonadaceae bacterium]MBO6963669.1 VOC family protein [Kordiimonadaceae bacterium]
MRRNPVIPSLYAPDLDATIAYYVETLGFEETGNWTEDGTRTWAEVSLGSSIVWFFANPIDDRPSAMMSGMIFIFVDDVDSVAERLRGEVDFRWGPEEQPYGLREVGVEDPNGYLLVFAQDT